MKIVLDANIVFSGILNTNSKIGDLLMNSEQFFTFISPYFLKNEIQNHYLKLVKISGLALPEILEAEFQIYKEIDFISEDQVKDLHWMDAELLVADVDPKDIHYIAYSKQFECKLWSGDKILMKGLKKKGFNNFITTDELFQLRETFRNKI